MKSKIIRVLIIDDENAICSICRKYLSSLDNIIILGECSSVDEAETLIKATQPDLILLDIHLNGGTGFDLLKRFPKPGFKVIFITAFEQYAIKAIKLGALDYILKPIDEDEFLEAVDKVCSQSENINHYQIETANESIQGKPNRLIIRTFEALSIIKFDELIYCQSNSGYTTFHLVDNLEILVSRPIKDYENLLPSEIFIRTHQSFLVNINFIYQLKKDLTIVLKNKVEVPLSFRKKDEIIKRLEGRL